MIELKELTRIDGTKFSIPVFELWNEKQNFLLYVLGIDFVTEGYDWYFGEGIEVMFLNKLNDPEVYLLNQYTPHMTLMLQTIPEWDYKQYPNPEIVLLKAQRKIISLHDAKLLKVVH